MKVLIIISSVLFIFLILLTGVDLIQNIIFRLRRYRIGRWNNRETWENAIKKKCLKWLKNTPVVQLSDNKTYILLDYILGKYKNNTIQSWQKAGLILGLNECDELEIKDYLRKYKDELIDSNGMWRKPIDKVDFALLGYALLLVEREPMKIKPAMDWIIIMLENHFCEDEMYSYSMGRKTNIRFVDTLGMICPFLALYGKIYGEQKFCERAVQQIIKYQKVGTLSNSQLPCHAVDIYEKKPLGIYGWGRGTVWYTLAIIDTYNILKEDPLAKDLYEIIQEMAKEYCDYQNENGGFNTILQGGGVYDSSATAGMALFYYNCADIFQSKYYSDIADQAIECLIKMTMKDGAIDCCQGDTHGIGVFSTIFDVMPFAQGMTMRAVKRKKYYYE